MMSVPQVHKYNRPSNMSGTFFSMYRRIRSVEYRVLKCEAMISSFLNRSRRSNKIVQMDVAELVNLILAMRGGDERQLGNQNLGFVHRRAAIQPGRGGVAQIGQQRHAHFVGHVRAAHAQDRESARRSGSDTPAFSFRRRSHTMKPSDGTRCSVAETVTTCSRESSISSPGLIGTDRTAGGRGRAA